MGNCSSSSPQTSVIVPSDVHPPAGGKVGGAGNTQREEREEVVYIPPTLPSRSRSRIPVGWEEYMTDEEVAEEAAANFGFDL